MTTGTETEGLIIPRDTTELTVIRRQDGRNRWRVRVVERETGRIVTAREVFGAKDARPLDWLCRTETEADACYWRLMGQITVDERFGGIVGSSHDDVEITGEMLGEADE